MSFTPLRPDDPTRVGPYRLTGRLGAGGMGVVYLARTRAGVPVALKLILPEYAADATFRARFSREVEVGRRVHGVCIARFLDADPDAERPYLVTEYVDGPGLGEVVVRRGPFVGEQLRALAAGLAEGLVSLHRAGVVHRDLKPANVLLARDAPKIIDFGIAHSGDATSMTRTGHVVGSAGWMAPEQASGDRVTTAADVFAWASVLTYASTGRPPFGEGQPAAVIYRVVHHEPDLAGVPDALLPALQAAFAKDPSERPEPAALLGLVTGDDGGDPTGEITRVLDVAWLPVAAVAPAAAEAARRAIDEPTPVPAPAEEAGRRRNAGARAAMAVVAVVALAIGAGLAWVVTRDGDGAAAPATTTTATTTSTTATTTTTTATTTSTTATTTTTTTLAPPPPPTSDQAWAEVEAGLAGGSASSGIITGGGEELAVTATGSEATVWTWRDDAWTETGFHFLEADIARPDALEQVDLTRGPRTDLVVALAGDRASVLSLVTPRGRIVEFEIPDSDFTTATIDELAVAGREVRGRLADVDGRITWRYDNADERFEVDDIDDDDDDDDDD